ncbi:hypothetical protein PENSPDRAFT_656210 [Peniophora sp. CONT]|nr:hypothetical protein PENSPDRAFT_656210 [Peniophora sp. CONT]
MDCDSDIHSDELDRPSPILDLPPELFLQIVSVLVLDWPPTTKRRYMVITTDTDSSIRLCGSLGWMNVTHICRHWRELCIGTRTLWTRWIGRLPSALPEILSRAGNETALHVDVDVDFDADEPLIRCWYIWDALPRLSRICAMSWIVPDSVIADSLAARLCSVSASDALRHLAHLVIRAYVDPISLRAIRDQGDSLHAPTLRTLSLGQSWISRIQAPLLTVLELRRPRKTMNQNDFYDLLVDCPMLTSLSIIEGCFEPYREREQNALPLPHLEYFHLDDPISVTGMSRESILRFFRSVLLIPPTAAIEVAIAQRELPDEIFAKAIFAFCVDNIAQVDAPDTLCLYASTIVLSLGTSTISAPYTEWRVSTLPYAKKRAQITCGLDAIELIPYFIHPDFDRYTRCLHTITVLSLDSPWLLDDDAYRHAIQDLLQTLPSLRIIRIASNPSWDELLEPLGSLNPDTGGLLLPDLEALWLDGAYQSEMEISGYDPAMDRVQLHSLTSTLVTRSCLLSEAGMGRSPCTIFLHGFDSISPDDACVQLLRSEVAEVVFLGADS